MKGDFSRVTFDPTRHYSGVLQQQGRVTLDADANEQVEILLHYVRTLASDLLGPHAVPAGAGFELAVDTNGLHLTRGHCYVDGILLENDVDDWSYTEQKDYPLPEHDPLSEQIQIHQGLTCWVYLDVWERYITALDDDDIREKALGGPDTCGRSKVVWQVKGLPYDAGMPDIKDFEPCATPMAGWRSFSEAHLAARVDPGSTDEDPCVLPPDSMYRGAENHLYRVEIHEGGQGEEATFKWSRDNGSVTAAWMDTKGNDLVVSRSSGFKVGDWVELSDDTLELQGKSGRLVNLVGVEGDLLSVDPATVPAEGIGLERNTDQAEGATLGSGRDRGLGPHQGGASRQGNAGRRRGVRRGLDRSGGWNSGSVPGRRRVSNRGLLADPGSGGDRQHRMAVGVRPGRECGPGDDATTRY